MSESKKLIRKWIEAFTKKDLEAVMDCYADDAVNFQVAAGEPAVGKEQIRKDTMEFFRGFPDFLLDCRKHYRRRRLGGVGMERRRNFLRRILRQSADGQKI